jgi:tetratricopeptide (TPR) repeat protein
MRPAVTTVVSGFRRTGQVRLKAVTTGIRSQAAFALLVALLAPPAVDAAQRRYIESPAAPVFREGMKLLSAEHWREAADAFEQAIDLDEQYALAFYGLGRARIGEKQYVAAVHALERCAALFISQAAERTSQQMGAAQRRQDLILELREHLRYLQSGPQSARRQLQAQQIQENIHDLELAMREGIGDMTLRVPAFVSLSLGSAHFRRGSMPDAEREYRNALRANPKMGEAHNNLAVVLLTTGRPEDASKSIKDAERYGYRVNPQFKKDIETAAKR